MAESRLASLIDMFRQKFIEPPSGPVDYTKRGARQQAEVDRERLTPMQFAAKYGDMPDTYMKRFDR